MKRLAATQAQRGERATLRLIALISATVVLLTILAARMLGPSDIYHQTQPRTVSYTTDIIVRGRWLLPVEQDVLPATKPPLYNWLAVPFVKVLGFSSDFAHKAPSVLAVIGTWALMLWLGARIGASAADDQKFAALGGLTAIATIANFATFKLGYLARPDMLLTFFMLVAWIAATYTALGEFRRARWIFWCAVAFACLTKGPVGLVPVAFLIILLLIRRAPKSQWRAVAWGRGIALVIILFGGWLAAAFLIDRQHVVEQLWGSEFFGRIVGTGGDERERNPLAIITGLLDMPAYFLIRGAPWSILAVAAMIIIWCRRDRIAAPIRPWLASASIWILLLVILFSLSAGKRADYIASAYAPAALLAAWFLITQPSVGRAWPASSGTLTTSDKAGTARPTRSSRGLALASAAVVTIATLTTLIIVNERETGAPWPGYGDALNEFIDAAEREIRARPLPIAFWRLEGRHVPAYLGLSADPRLPALREAMRRHDALWVVAGQRPEPPFEFEDHPLATNSDFHITRIAESRAVSERGAEPHQVFLYLLERE